MLGIVFSVCLGVLEGFLGQLVGFVGEVLLLFWDFFLLILFCSGVFSWFFFLKTHQQNNL